METHSYESRATEIVHQGITTEVEQMATFASGARFESLGLDTRQQLKIRILDALGCGIGALDGGPIKMIRGYINELGTPAHCTLIGGGCTDIERAALYNSALIRYLDFNDSYLAKGETCHPSDNLGAILAAGEYIGATGPDLMIALAVAYQIQCRLCDVAPVRARGFDHTVQGAYAVAAGISRILKLDRSQTANAIAISGTAFVALRVTRPEDCRIGRDSPTRTWQLVALAPRCWPDKESRALWKQLKERRD